MFIKDSLKFMGLQAFSVQNSGFMSDLCGALAYMNPCLLKLHLYYHFFLLGQHFQTGSLELVTMVGNQLFSSSACQFERSAHSWSSARKVYIICLI